MIFLKLNEIEKEDDEIKIKFNLCIKRNHIYTRKC